MLFFGRGFLFRAAPDKQTLGTSTGWKIWGQVSAGRVGKASTFSVIIVLTTNFSLVR